MVGAGTLCVRGKAETGAFSSWRIDDFGET